MTIQGTAFGVAETLSEEDARHLIKATVNTKHRLLLTLLYGVGLLGSEAVRLTFEDFKPEAGLLVVPSVDTRRAAGERVVPLGPAIQAAMFDHFGASWVDGKGFVFHASRECGHISERALQRIVEEAAHRIGITTAVCPRMLRDAFAVHSLRRGMSGPVLARVLGVRRRTVYRYREGVEVLISYVRGPLDGS